MNQIIDENFHFELGMNITLKEVHDSLEKFREGFIDAMKLSDKYDLFLDTNIYLGYYGMSIKQKKVLIKFLKKNKDRIIITDEIQKEILRNRISVIQKDFFAPIKKVSTDYVTMKKTVMGGAVESYKNDKKSILTEDYPDLWKNLVNMQDEIKMIFENYSDIQEGIRKSTEETANSYKDIVVADDLLNILKDIKVIERLDDKEKSFLKSKYDEYTIMYKQIKSSKQTEFAFPGCGDSKEDPYGDFIIFHEIIKFLKNSQKQAIFLTNDVTKKDWLRSDRKPFTHYIENIYKLTENTLYILEASPVLKISFENIYGEDTNGNTLSNFKVIIKSIEEQSSNIFYNFLEPDRKNVLAHSTIMEKLCNKYNLIGKSDLFLYFRVVKHTNIALENNGIFPTGDNIKEQILEKLIDLDIVLYSIYEYLSK